MAEMTAKKKKSDNLYRRIRESLGLSRERASELLGQITPERLEKIETNKSTPHPDEIKCMAEKYRHPELCNYYCSRACEIGQDEVKEINMSELSQIVLQMIASLNSAGKEKDRLIEITADGIIGSDEIKDFVHIQDELEKISDAVDALQLWSKKMLDSGMIDLEEYRKYRPQKKE